jgi:hypothetical protein
VDLVLRDPPFCEGGRFLRREVKKIDEIARQIGVTVREVVNDWPRTVRLVVLVAAIAAAVTCHHLLTR